MAVKCWRAISLCVDNSQCLCHIDTVDMALRMLDSEPARGCWGVAPSKLVTWLDVHLFSTLSWECGLLIGFGCPYLLRRTTAIIFFGISTRDAGYGCQMLACYFIVCGQQSVSLPHRYCGHGLANAGFGTCKRMLGCRTKPAGDLVGCPSVLDTILGVWLAD